jgi:hypothetical protein
MSILDHYRSSERGDFRVMAAIATIGQEFAAQATAVEPDRQTPLIVPAPTPAPAIVTTGYADDDFAPAHFDAAPIAPLPTPQNTAVAASRLGKAFITGMRKTFIRAMRKRRKPVLPTPAQLRSPVKTQRPPRARARRAVRSPHSRSAPGGVRKGGDDGGGDGSPSQRLLSCWTCGGATEVGTMVADTDHVMCDHCQPFSDRDVIRLSDPEWLRMQRPRAAR